MRVPAQVGHPGFEAVACAQRLVVEDQKQGLVFQQVMLLPDSPLALEILSDVQDGFDFLAGVIQQGQKITSSVCIGLHANTPFLVAKSKANYTPLDKVSRKCSPC